MSLLQCTEDCLLSEFASRQGVDVHALWLPLRAALPKRSSSTAVLAVDAKTQVAMLESATGTLLVDKYAICAKLHVANALQCATATVFIDPTAVPAGCEVFMRWARPGAKRLRGNTAVLHYALPDDTREAPSTVSAGAVAGAKRSRPDDASSTAASSLMGSLQGKQKRLSLAQRSAEDLQRRLSAVVAARGVPPHPRAARILQSTLASISRRLGQPPLHFVLPHHAEALEAGGVTWARSNGRLLSRVFRSAASEERSEGAKYGDGSRQVRFYFIEDVLLRRPRQWRAAAPQQPQEHAATGAAVDGDAEVLLQQNGVLDDMHRHAERGFRIVLLEHYPVLHHGSRYGVEQTLAPVVRLCREVCAQLTVTVLLSAMSCVTAMRKQGMALSCVLPHAGLLPFFVAELNTSLAPDQKMSAVVGSGDRGSPFLNPLHRDFARHASLPYVDVNELPSVPV